VVADWLQRPPRRRPVRPVIPTGQLEHARGRKHLENDMSGTTGLSRMRTSWSG
jgi:hypothetical protein